MQQTSEIDALNASIIKLRNENNHLLQEVAQVKDKVIEVEQEN